MSHLGQLGSYVQNLQTLQKIRKLAGGELDLPQICVIGDQSSGKSSLLEALTSIQFPVKGGICTKAPIVVKCERDEKLLEDSYAIKDSNSSSFINCRKEEVANTILMIQSNLLDVDSKDSSVISPQEIHVRVRGPDQFDIVVIDLPGIINVEKGKKETHELIISYIKRTQTLILLVSVCDQDKELCTALDLANKYDPEHKRTLRIITKIDRLESSSTNVIEQLTKFMEEPGHSQEIYDLFPHAVVCRVKGEALYDELKEKNILESYNLYGKNGGIPSLKSRLLEIYDALIRKNIPPLKESVKKILETVNKEINKIGSTPLPPRLMLTEFRRLLIEDDMMFEIDLSVPYDQLRDKIIQTKNQINKEWIADKLKSNRYRNPVFYGNTAFLSCMKDIVNWWSVLVDEYRKEVENICLRSLKFNKGEINFVSHRLINSARCEWNYFCIELFKNFMIKCNILLKKTIEFGTSNVKFMSGFEYQQTIPDDMMYDIVNAAEEIHNNYNRNQGCYSAQLNQRINQIKAKWKNIFESTDITIQQQDRLYNTVLSAWDVEKDTFLDNLLKDSRDYIVKARKEWIEVTMILNENIMNNAKEDKNMAQKRKILSDKLKRFNECKELLVKLQIF